MLEKILNIVIFLIVLVGAIAGLILFGIFMLFFITFIL